MLHLFGIRRVNGCVEALSSVQCDLVLMPRAHHTQTTMTVLNTYIILTVADNATLINSARVHMQKHQYFIKPICCY